MYLIYICTLYMCTKLKDNNETYDAHPLYLGEGNLEFQQVKSTELIGHHLDEKINMKDNLCTCIGGGG